MNNLQPLQYLTLDGKGGSQPAAIEQIDNRKPGQVEWLHLDYKDAA